MGRDDVPPDESYKTMRGLALRAVRSSRIGGFLDSDVHRVARLADPFQCSLAADPVSLLSLLEDLSFAVSVVGEHGSRLLGFDELFQEWCDAGMVGQSAVIFWGPHWRLASSPVRGYA